MSDAHSALLQRQPTWAENHLRPPEGASGLRLRGHSREPMSLTIKSKPRLGSTTEQLGSWIEARRVVERARQDDDYSGIGLACICYA